MKEKTRKIIFYTALALFGFVWVSSLVFLGFAVFSENITEAIEGAYTKVFEEKTLNLHKVTMWSTTLSTIALLLTLLAQEIKKRYR